MSSMGNQVEAEALMREALSQQTRLLGADHPSTLNSASNLAVFLIRNGKAPEAEAMCHEVLDRRRRVMGRDHPDTLISINIVGFALLNQNKPAQAEPFIRDAIAISGRINGEDHMDTLLYTHNLGALLQDQKKANEAEPLFRTVIERAERTIGRAHPMAMSATAKLAGILYDQRRLAESAAVLATAEPFARKATTPAGERSLAELLTNLGKARMGLNQLVDAEAGLLESHRIWIKTRGEDHADTRHCIRAIIDLYTTWHAAEPGKGYDTKADQWKAKLPQEVGPPPPQEKE